MSKYEYYDDDVENEVNHAQFGNEDITEIQFKTPVEAFSIHKYDVVHLAKCFGLIVYEKDSSL